MGLFSATKYRGEPELEQTALRDADRSETHELLERLAAALVDEVSVEQPAWLAAYQQEFERDKAGYAFDCRKHGDFLTLYVTRSGNQQDGRQWITHPSNLATTINLSLCREIRFTPGLAPDMNGELTFGYRMESDTGSGTVIGGTGFGNYAAPAGYQWKVRKPELYVPTSRPLILIDAPRAEDHHGGVMYSHDRSYTIKTTVGNAARLAKDDVIRFEGLATLYAPATMGERVHASVLGTL